MSLATPRKGYKSVPWLFGKEIEIPEEWEVKRIKNIAKVSVGLVINPSTYFDKNGTIPMITGKNVTEKGIMLDNVDLITKKSNELLETTRIWKDDLVTMRVGYPGRTCLVKNEHDGINCASVIITRKNKKYYSQFLQYITNSKLTEQQITKYTAGGAQQVVNISSWNKFLIILPPLPEQQKIASILSNVDNLIESTGKVITHSKKVKTGLMQKLLTRGIGHTKFKKVPWLFGKEIEIPEKWEVCKIRNLVENKTILEIQDGNHGELHPKSIDFVNQGIPFVTADCIINNNVDYKKCKLLPSGFLKTLRIGFSKKGDVILTHKGSIGFTAIVNDEFETIILSPQTTYYRLSDKLIPKFLHYIFQTHNFQKQLQAFGKQSTRDYVGITAQQHLIIPFIQDVIEQQKIVSILSNIDSKITSQEQYKEKLEKLKKSLMQKLLTGEVRVKT